MVKFKEYKIKELFDIHPTKSYGLTNNKLFSSTGKTPVVVNSSINNGIGGYVDLPPTEKGNIITFSDTTTDSAIFYQPHDFIGYSHVQGVYPLEKEKWTQNSLLYFLTLFKKCAKGRFDYATKFNRNLALEMIISLPMKDNGDIDYKYMEEWIKELEEERIKELEKYLKVSGLNNYKLTETDKLIIDKNIQYKDFKLEDIIDWQPQKEIDPLKIDILKIDNNKKYPFYGQATINNGIISYLNLTEKVLNNKERKPTILIHSNNQNVVYLETPFYLKDGHGATSVLQSEFLNEKRALYIMSSIKKVITKKFSYNEKATKIALKNTCIKLPINKKNEIDYDYMEKYITVQQKLAIKNIIDWRENQINVTKQIVNNA